MSCFKRTHHAPQYLWVSGTIRFSEAGLSGPSTMRLRSLGLQLNT